MYSEEKHSGFENMNHIGIPINDICDGCDNSDERTKKFISFLTETTRNPSTMYLVTDAQKPDGNIVACSLAWCDRCGYNGAEIVNRSCRFLQGPATDAKRIKTIVKSIQHKETIHTVLMNYKRTHEPFKNDFVMFPLLGSDGEVMYYASIHEPSADTISAVNNICRIQIHRWCRSWLVELNHVNASDAHMGWYIWSKHKWMHPTSSTACSRSEENLPDFYRAGNFRYKTANGWFYLHYLSHTRIRKFTSFSTHKILLRKDGWWNFRKRNIQDSRTWSIGTPQWCMWWHVTLLTKGKRHL